MSEIVKVDGKWNLTPQLATELGFKSLAALVKHFKKEYIIPHLSAQIDRKNLKGDKRSGARQGFGEIWIDGQKKRISGVTAYFDERSSNVTLPDTEKDKVVKQTRSEGQYGYNKETVNQINFLNDVEELKAKLKDRTDFPKGPEDARDAVKDFDRDMKKLFRKNYRGRIKYDPNKNYGWPEGKSKEGYEKWQRYVYNRLGENRDGKLVHIGHGKPVGKGGTNSASNLALEDATSNMSTGDKEGTFRSDEDLERVYVSHGKSLSLQEYLAFEDDENIMTPMDLLPEDHGNLLQLVDEDPEAILAQGLRNKENQALSNYNDGGALKVNDFMTNDNIFGEKSEADIKLEQYNKDLIEGYERDEQIVHDMTAINRNLETAGEVVHDYLLAPALDSVSGSGYTTVKTGLEITENLKNKDILGAATKLHKLRLTTDSPLIKTQRHGYKAMTADIAGK